MIGKLNIKSPLFELAELLRIITGLPRFDLRQVRPVYSAKGKAEVIRDDSEAVASEALGRRAVRQGRWKATWLEKPFGPDGWQLFDIVADPTERNDLANSKREKLNELILLWENYADEVGVVLPSTKIELKD